ncbi:hypothetical protein EYZ78_15155 [Shigella flexneri]|nr:hypothetical protein [Escherichia coli]EFW0984868.1 hypothetical protein [Shigella boydii]EGO8401627.1 hypothetical protein [Shigella flexneri]EFW6661147.1 hypothetical protein [Shigella boydii]EFW6993819.1 hypothetical protein [Shigella boydii]
MHEIKASREKWTKWSNFTLKQQKQKTKHVIFGTYRQFKNITLKIKGPKLKPFIINKLNVLFLHHNKYFVVTNY